MNCSFTDINSELNILLTKAFTLSVPLQNNEDPPTQANLFSITGGVGVGVPIIPMQSKQYQSSAECEPAKPIWNNIWIISKRLDDQLGQASQSKTNIGKIIDKCVPMFNQVSYYIS